MPTPKAQSASSRMKKGSRRIDHPMVSPYHIARPTTMIDATAKSSKDRAKEAGGNISTRTAICFRHGTVHIILGPAPVTPAAEKNGRADCREQGVTVSKVTAGG